MERAVCLIIVMLSWVDVNVFILFISVGSSLWLQDSEGFVVAAPGPSQCSRPQVSVGRFPLKQDSAQVPRCGCKEHRELSNQKLCFKKKRCLQLYHRPSLQLHLILFKLKQGL